MTIPAILFDFDNTIAATNKLTSIRESRQYGDLTPEVLAPIKLFPKVLPLLQEIKRRGIKLGIVTNSSRTYINILLNHFDLKEVFDVVISYTDVKAQGMKPSPAGINLALDRLGLAASKNIYYVGDRDLDLIAAYRAGITPVLPTWGSREPVTIAPALELSTSLFHELLDNPEEYKLFAEICEDKKTLNFPHNKSYFLPLDAEARVPIQKEEMKAVCLGRYFSKATSATSKFHFTHNLSLKIAEKSDSEIFIPPSYWIDFLERIIKNWDKLIEKDFNFDIVTVIPSKPEKDQRLERLLALIEEKYNANKNAKKISFIDDIFYFDSEARPQKTLTRKDRITNVREHLHLKDSQIPLIQGKNILVIDDIITTGSTISRAYSLLDGNGAGNTFGLTVAKNITIEDDEKICPNCQGILNVKKGYKDKPFWGCSNYNSEIKCTYKDEFYKKTCPNCERPMQLCVNKNKEKYWSCFLHKNPKCSQTLSFNLSEISS